LLFKFGDRDREGRCSKPRNKAEKFLYENIKEKQPERITGYGPGFGGGRGGTQGRVPMHDIPYTIGEHIYKNKNNKTMDSRNTYIRL
jgi:hypothetical protein